MNVDRPEFYKNYRNRFEKPLTDKQVEGYEAIFNDWDAASLNDFRWLAYALATAYHETGRRIEPVREGFCDTDEGSIKAVTRLFNQGRIRRNYAIAHANGKSYFGRGLVQITHGYNYEKLGKAIGIGMKLYDDPSLALDSKTAVKIMLVGMNEGLFTGHRFSEYFNDEETDWFNARRIINGLDRAQQIADYAVNFYECLYL